MSTRFSQTSEDNKLSADRSELRANRYAYPSTRIDVQAQGAAHAVFIVLADMGTSINVKWFDRCVLNNLKWEMGNRGKELCREASKNVWGHNDDERHLTGKKAEEIRYS